MFTLKHSCFAYEIKFNVIIIRCIGSTQHLKSKYGSEYVLELELAAEKDESNTSVHRQTRADDMIKELFGQSDNIKLVEQVADHFVYRIPQNCVALLSGVFAHLENCKSYGVCDEVKIGM